MYGCVDECSTGVQFLLLAYSCLYNSADKANILHMFIDAIKIAKIASFYPDTEIVKIVEKSIILHCVDL